MRFFLGTHIAGFLWNERFRNVPLFISARILRTVKTLRRALTEWACDSGGFTELTMFGGWKTTPAQYVAELRQWSRAVGSMQWAAPQDWMCEEFVCASTLLAEGLIAPDRTKYAYLIERVKPAKRTAAKCRELLVASCLPLPRSVWGGRIVEHQARTVANYLKLKRLAPELPIVPVLQGYAVADYMRHADDYRRAGIDLAALPIVGVGSVCRRQASEEAAGIIRAVVARGIRPHGFGFKVEGLRLCGNVMASADSLAWSFAGRKRPDPNCRHGKDGKGGCQNCPTYALNWRRDYIGSAAPEVLAAGDSWSPFNLNEDGF